MRAHPIWTTTTGLVIATVLSILLWPEDPDRTAYADAWRDGAPITAAANVQLVAPGVTEPRSRTIQLASELGGYLRAIHVQAGDRVRQGQVLAELDNDIQKLSVEMAEAVLERTRADLRRLEQGDREDERAVTRAGLDEAEANLRLAEFEANRIAEMNRQQAVSDREVAEVASTLALAKARREAAAGRWRLSCAGAREEDLAYARAAVREAEAKLKTTQAVLEKTFIRSPIDGMVISRHSEPGEALPTGLSTPVLSVGDCSATRVRVDVDEMDVNKVALGQQVYATAVAYGDRRFTGRVVHIEPTLGRKNFRTQRPTERQDTRVQEVVVELDEAPGLPMELQMVAWFLHPQQTSNPAQLAAARN